MPLIYLLIASVLAACSDGLLSFGSGGGGGGGGGSGGGSGIVATPNASVKVIFFDTANSGMIYIGGIFTSVGGLQAGRIARVHPNGTLDTQFSTNTGAGFNSSVEAIYADSNGVYVGGAFDSFNLLTSTPRIVRLTSEGNVDAAFNVGSGFANPVGTVHDIIGSVDAPGDVYVSGNFDTYNGNTGTSGMARINSDGSNDANFGLPLSGFNGIATRMVQQTGGSTLIFVGGNFTNVSGNARTHTVAIATNGNVDGGYDSSGAGGPDAALSAISTIGVNILAAGGFSNAFGVTNGRVALASNGTWTPIATQQFLLGFNATVNDVAVVDSGTFYAVGAFGTYNDSANFTTPKIARIFTNESLDTNFNPGSGFSGGSAPEVVLLGSEGKVYVGGGFTTFNGMAIPNLLRLNSNGTLDSTFIAP